MTQSIADESDPTADGDDAGIESAYLKDPYRDLPRAKPEERITRGARPEDIFGICAEEFDDEYMQAVLAIRRG
ncbi:MAG: hypothetical protein WDO68_24115 [Gammaproteobacteria bacterium]